MKEKVLSILNEWMLQQKTIEKMVISNDGCIVVSNGGDDTSISFQALCALNEQLNTHNVCVSSIFSPGVLDEAESLTLFLDYVNNPERWDFALDWDIEGNQEWTFEK